MLSSLSLRFAGGELRLPWPGPAWPRVQLLTFMYTRCPTVCSTVGMSFAQLQREIVSDPHARDIGLLSISFDPSHDDTRALEAYASRHGAEPSHSRIRIRGEAGALFVARVDDAKRALQELLIKAENVIAGYAKDVPHPVRVKSLNQILANVCRLKHWGLRPNLARAMDPVKSRSAANQVAED